MKIAISPTAPVEVITAMWRRIDPVANRGDVGAGGSGGSAGSDMAPSFDASGALGNSEIPQQCRC
jgi:hypothetical protein